VVAGRVVEVGADPEDVDPDDVDPDDVDPDDVDPDDVDPDDCAVCDDVNPVELDPGVASATATPIAKVVPPARRATAADARRTLARAAARVPGLWLRAGGYMWGSLVRGPPVVDLRRCSSNAAELGGGSASAEHHL
jgi:hypothetical protein